jgi:SAM-dependent methyltransferase
MPGKSSNVMTATSPSERAPKLYFAQFKDWRPVERRAIRYVRGRVLDVGCGAGRAMLHLQKRGLEVVGIDNSPAVMEACRLRGATNAHVMPIDRVSLDLGTFEHPGLLPSADLRWWLAEDKQALGFPAFYEVTSAGPVPARRDGQVKGQRHTTGRDLRFQSHLRPVPGTLAHRTYQPGDFIRLLLRSLRGLDLNQRLLGYESGGLLPSVPSGAVSCRPFRASCRRSPSFAAEVRVVRLQMVCTKASRPTLCIAD